jgi:hypothetical protein
MSIQDLDKTDLKKVLNHYNKSLKKETLKLTGSKKVLLERVLKEFKHNVSRDKKTILFIHKKKKSLPTYTLNLKGTEKRKEEDKEDKRVLEAKRKKMLERKKAKEKKEAEKLNKIRQEERVKVLKALTALKKIKQRTKDKQKLKVVNKKLTALERQKKLLSTSRRLKIPDIKPIVNIQKKIDTKKLDLSKLKMPKAIISKGKQIQKGLIADGFMDKKTTINELIGADINKDVSIYFSCAGFNFIYLFLYILKKNNNDCIIVSPKLRVEDNRVKVGDEEPSVWNGVFDLFSITYGRSLSFPDGLNKTEFFDLLTKCLDNNSSVVIPLLLRGHANAITINKNTMEIARFEPHGGESRFKISSSRIDNMVKNMFRNYKYKGKKFDVLGAEESCPAVSGKFLGKEFRGLQSFSGVSSGGQKKIGDPGGFCCIWSLFIMDLSLKYPKEKMADIRERAQKLLGTWKKSRGEKTPEVRKWIRGYTKYIQEGAREIMKDGIEFIMIGGVEDEGDERLNKEILKKIGGKLTIKSFDKAVQDDHPYQYYIMYAFFIFVIKEVLKYRGSKSK